MCGVPEQRWERPWLGVTVPVIYRSRVCPCSHPAALRWREGAGGIGLALLLVLTVAVTTAWAQFGLVSREGFFTITWNVDRSGPQQVAIVGWVSHDHDRTASEVRLQVEGVNTSGEVVSGAVGSVDHEIPPAGESFFEIRLTPVGTEVTFQVSVISYRFVVGMTEAP
ncbi:MAG: hypothetical protein ACE5FK_05735 [Candidatus Methylomirabilia bacterium]